MSFDPKKEMGESLMHVIVFSRMIAGFLRYCFLDVPESVSFDIEFVRGNAV